MNMKRLLASVLALLLVVSLLPMTAMAEDNVGYMEENKYFSTIETNGTSDGGRESGTVNTNKGTIINNYGTVIINEAETESENPTISKNYGLVKTNDGKVTENMNGGDVTTNNGTVGTNNGAVTTNNGTVGTNNGGTVGTNNDTVKVNNNGGTVETNANKGKVETNNGTVITNNGTVNANNNGGTVGTNNGTVKANNNGGTVVTNSGTVTTNNGEVEQNSGEVQKNFGTVETNKSGGTVGDDITYDPDTGNYGFSLSGGNFGTITTNEGIVSQNGGTMHVSDGNGGYTPQTYTGTITTNAKSGTVLQNSDGSTITENYGTVVSNDGTVTNKAGGEVEMNQGTVINEEGGILYDYSCSGWDSDDPPETINTITDAGTYHLIAIDKGFLHEDGDTYTWTDPFVWLQRQSGDQIDLTNLFQQDGYKVSSYYEKVGKDYIEGSSTTFTASDKPSYLFLIWEKIQAICSSVSDKEETKPVKAPSVPTTVAAEDVKVGTVVRVKGQIFKVIEMDDGSITVVTMGKLSKKDLADLMAFLAKYLTPEQIELLLGNPELISEELAAKLFGGNTNHIVFKAAKNLFAK